MLVEIFLGFIALQPLQRSLRFRTTVLNPISRRLLLGLTPFSLFARSAKIDDVAHVKLGGNQMLLRRAGAAHLVRMITPLRWHWNTAIAGPSGCGLQLPREVCLYP